MRSFNFITLILLFSTIFSGCMPDSIRVAAVLPLTGDDAATGEAVRRGIDLAVEQLGEEATVVVEISDSRSDAEFAAKQLEKNFRSGMSAAIGGVDVGETEALIRIADEFEHALLSPAASAPHLSGTSQNLYRIAPSQRSSAVALAMTAGFLKARSAVVISQPSRVGPESTKIFAESLGDHGGRIMASYETEGEVDFAAQIAKKSPDVVYVASSKQLAGEMISALRSAEYGGPILTAEGLSGADLAALERQAEGVYLSRAVADLNENDNGHFVGAYRERYGEEPDLYAAYGYDAVHALVKALEGRALLPSELRKGLRDAEIAGVTGLFDFDHRGDVPRYPRVYRVAEGGELIDFKEELRERELRLRERKRTLQAEARLLNERMESLGS